MGRTGDTFTAILTVASACCMLYRRHFVLTVHPSFVQVAVRPQLPPLTVDAFPDSLVSMSNLCSILPSSDWDKLSQATFRAANYRWVHHDLQ